MSRRLVIGAPEIVAAVAAIAIAAHFALPLVQGAQMRGRSEKALHDVETVRRAAEAAAARSGSWPDDGAAGELPGSLEPFLPPGFKFERDGYRLDWDSWALSDGLVPDSPRGTFAAVSVVSDDARLAAFIEQELHGHRPHLRIGNRTTFVLSEPLEPSR